MPDYRKKSHRIISPKGKKTPRTTNKNGNNIPMKPHKSKKSEFSLGDTTVRVVNGKKLESKRKLRVFFFSAVAVILIATSLFFLLPGGLFENAINIFAIMGTGKYPCEIYGTNTIDSEKQNGYYYVLTDTNLYAYSNGGKQVYSVAHGFENPVLKTSETRALIYDQGGNVLNIYNLQKKVETVETKLPIICASLSSSGSFAVATHSKDCASTVTVYSKSGKNLYEWNCAKDIINNVLVSPYTKKLALTTVNSSGAEAVSKLMVFNFDSADPIHSLDLGDDIVYDLSTASSGFSVITENDYRYIKWSNFKEKKISSDFELSMFRKTSSGSLLVFNRSNDRSDNRIITVSPYGEKKAEISFKGIINDIALSKGHIYCISDLNTHIINKDGEIVKSGSAEYGCKRIAVIGNNTVAEITDSEIFKISIDNKE